MSQLSLSTFLTEAVNDGNVIGAKQELILQQEINVPKERESIRIIISSKSLKEINAELWQLVENNTYHSEDLINYYEGLGAEIKSEKGIIGLHETRQQNYGQFFTSLRASKFIVDFLQIPENATVLDSSCGTGRLAWHLKNKRLFTGIEFEEKAYQIAKRIYPDSVIINDSLINHNVKDEFDYVLINPPFSLQLKSLFGNFKFISYGGGILSHIAALEQAVRAVRYGGFIAAILPSNIWNLESSRLFHKWLQENTDEVARISLPKDTFTSTEWETTLFIFRKYSRHYRDEDELKTFVCMLHSYSETEKLVNEFSRTKFFSAVSEYSSECSSAEPIILKACEQKDSNEVKIRPSLLPDNLEAPKVALKVVKNKLVIKPNNLLASIRLANVKANFEVEYDHSLRDYVATLPANLSLSKAWTGELEFEQLPFIDLLRKYDIAYDIDPQLLNWIKKKKRYYARESSSIEQWIKPTEDADWEEANADKGIRQLSKLYKQKRMELENYYEKYPHLRILYNYQKDDVVRLSMKRSAIIALQQGLGKTKLGIALAILKSCKRNLFVVPSHLIETWTTEFRNFGIDFKLIDSDADLRRLRKFNLISYNKLKSRVRGKRIKIKVDRRTGKDIDKTITFAHALKRRFKVMIVDEAHYCSNKTAEQTKAVARMKPRHVYLMTGTPIGNTVKNLYSLLDIGWHSGSPFFPYSTRAFREQFVTVEWVTPEFEDTLAKGRTAQQMADIKDIPKFIELMESKWLRRVKIEPKVQECISIPQPIIQEVVCKPEMEQLVHYKAHLEEFATIFKRYMHPEEDESHKVNQSIVLAQLQNLQFCATIPQHPKVNPSENFRYKGSVTVSQNEILKLIDKHHKSNEKIVVFTNRPDFCELMKKWLKEKNIESEIFTGRVDIDSRNKRLGLFRNGKLNVLLASINVTDTGLNIPEANAAIICEPAWKFSIIEQAYCRILRPQTKGSPVVYLVRNEGTIDQYLWQHCMSKKGAIEEGLERKEDVEKHEWVHWRDFIIRMLTAEGLWK